MFITWPCPASCNVWFFGWQVYTHHRRLFPSVLVARRLLTSPGSWNTWVLNTWRLSTVHQSPVIHWVIRKCWTGSYSMQETSVAAGWRCTRSWDTQGSFLKSLLKLESSSSLSRFLKASCHTKLWGVKNPKLCNLCAVNKARNLYKKLSRLTNSMQGNRQQDRILQWPSLECPKNHELSHSLGHITTVGKRMKWW